MPSTLSPIVEVVSNVGFWYNPLMMLRALGEIPNRSRAMIMALWSIESKACFQSKNIFCIGCLVASDHSIALLRINKGC